MTALYAYTALVLLGLIGPIAVVVAASFTAGDTMGFPPEGWSLRWYRAFLDDGEFVQRRYRCCPRCLARRRPWRWHATSRDGGWPRRS